MYKHNSDFGQTILPCVTWSVSGQLTGTEDEWDHLRSSPNLWGSFGFVHARIFVAIQNVSSSSVFILKSVVEIESAQVSKPAVSPISKSAGCGDVKTLEGPFGARVWKPAIQPRRGVGALRKRAGSRQFARSMM